MQHSEHSALLQTCVCAYTLLAVGLARKIFAEPPPTRFSGHAAVSSMLQESSCVCCGQD